MRADVLAERSDASVLATAEGKPAGESLVTADQLRPQGPYEHLYTYLLHTGFIVPLSPG